MAYVDRGGGRESKHHERRVKRGLLAKANPFEKAAAAAGPTLTESPPPLPIAAAVTPNSLIDAGCAINARALAREHARMLARAQTEGVAAILCFTRDFDKIGELATTVKSYPGFLYMCAGIHPDNVKRVNEKTILTRMAELRAVALSPETVALFTGLDLTRDLASHYSQQKLLTAHLDLAADVRLPVVIHQVAAAERLVEVIQEWKQQRVAETAAAVAAAAATASAAASGSAADGEKAASDPFDVPIAISGLDTLGADDKAFSQLLALGVYFIVDGIITEEGPAADAVRALVPRIPLDKLLIASNAPAHTPQNIPAIAKLYGAEATGATVAAADVAARAFANSVAFCKFPSGTAVSNESAAPAGAAAAGEASVDAADADDTADDDADNAIDGPVPEARPVAVDGDAAVPAAAPAETPAAPSAAPNVSVRYLCRSCRACLFDEADVRPHTSINIRPSAKATAGAALPGPSTEAPKATTGTGKGKKKGAAAAAAASPALGAASSIAPAGVDSDTFALAGGPARAPAAAITVGADVAVGRWHSSKGKHGSGEGLCTQVLVDYLAWMAIDPTEAEGSLLCPKCSSKVGQYNLGGLKCSCGLLVAPAYKIARNRVDEDLQGVDALEAALAAAELEERTLAAASAADDTEAGPEKKRNEKRLRVPVSKHKGNFSEFRNKST